MHQSDNLFFGISCTKVYHNYTECIESTYRPLNTFPLALLLSFLFLPLPLPFESDKCDDGFFTSTFSLFLLFEFPAGINDISFSPLTLLLLMILSSLDFCWLPPAPPALDTREPKERSLLLFLLFGASGRCDVDLEMCIFGVCCCCRCC